MGRKIFSGPNHLQQRNIARRVTEMNIEHYRHPSPAGRCFRLWRTQLRQWRATQHGSTSCVWTDAGAVKSTADNTEPTPAPHSQADPGPAESHSKTSDRHMKGLCHTGTDPSSSPKHARSAFQSPNT